MEAVSAMKWEIAIKEDLESHSTQSLPVIQGQASFTSCMENGKSHQLLCHDRKTDIFKISTKLGNFFCLKSFNDFTFQSWHVRPYSSTPAPYHPNLTYVSTSTISFQPTGLSIVLTVQASISLPPFFLGPSCFSFLS